MINGRFSLTANLLEDIFVEAIGSTVKDISSVFEIVDEEPITFTLVLKAKMHISEKTELIKKSVAKDIINVIQANPLRRADHYGINYYVEHNLIVDVVGHNRHFESARSGSDFGLLFSLPEIHNGWGSVNIKPSYNGILIQAKRNALAQKRPEVYGPLSRKFDYTDVKGFTAIALYKYEASKLMDIAFIKPIREEMSNEAYKKRLNAILKKRANIENIPAQDFFALFMNKKIGTSDREKIEKYIKDQKLPVFELRIYFKDDGRGLTAQLSVLNETKQVQTVKLWRG